MIFAKFEISNDYGKLLEQATTMPNFWKKISNNYRDFKIADYPNFYCVAYKKIMRVFTRILFFQEEKSNKCLFFYYL